MDPNEIMSAFLSTSCAVILKVKIYFSTYICNHRVRKKSKNVNFKELIPILSPSKRAKLTCCLSLYLFPSEVHGRSFAKEFKQ